MTEYWYLKPVGVDLFCIGKKFLVFNMVTRNFKIKYRRSVLGILWTLMGPIAQGFVYYFVFKYVLKVQLPHYLPFIMSGVLTWSFFSQSLMEGMEALVGNVGLFTKVPIPLQIFPFVGTITNFVSLIFALPVIIGACLISEVPLGMPSFFLFYYFAVLFLYVYFLSLMLSVAYIRLRDLKHIFSIGLQLLFYASPVMYSEQMIPTRFTWVMFANPVAMVFAGIHRSLIEQQVPTRLQLGLPLIWALVFMLITVFVFKNYTHELVEQI